MKPLQWYQNKIVSQVSFITAVVAVITTIISIAWNIRVTGEINKKVEQIEQNQLKQLEINGKMIVIYDMLIKEK